MSDNLKEREAFARYLAECDDCAIVPDVAGAFAWAWQTAIEADRVSRDVPAGYTSKVIESLYENGDPVSVDAAEEMKRLQDLLAASPQPQPVQAQPSENHGLDTAKRVCFYEQDFYVLSNFSSFTLQWRGERFDTSEAAYHYEKFPRDLGIRMQILRAPSAHEAFKIAERYKKDRRGDWDSVKVDIMRAILRAKASQHEYVKRKLLATGDRELVENSWRDDYWGWGPNRDGQNMLGKLWMEVRAELFAQTSTAEQTQKEE